MAHFILGCIFMGMFLALILHDVCILSHSDLKANHFTNKGKLFKITEVK